MKKSVIALLVLGCLALSGCNISITEENNKSESQSVSSSAVQQQTTSDVQSLPTQSIASQQDANIMKNETNTLDFLTEEQQALYQEAYDAQYWLYGAADNLESNGHTRLVGNQAYVWQVDANNQFVVQTPDGYSLYTNSYEDFMKYVYSVFSKSFVENLDFFEVKFVNFNGKLATNPTHECEYVQGFWRGVAEAYPDTFREVSSSDEKVTFNLISHYDKNMGNSGKIDVYTIERPITLIKEDGIWLVDEFHTTQFG